MVFILSALPMAHPAVSPRLFAARLKGKNGKREKEIRFCTPVLLFFTTETWREHTRKYTITSHLKTVRVEFVSRALPMAHPAVSPRLLKPRLRGTN